MSICYTSNINMVNINIKNLLLEAGIEELRPSKEALQEMGISRRRYTQLVENINKTPININEMEAIKKYIQGFQNINTDQLIGQTCSQINLIKENLGLTK
jgi:hypothetical protein